MTTKPDAKSIQPGDEDFLSRWSRLKRDAGAQPSPKPESGPADSHAPLPELPPLDKLTFESDYRGFLHPKVDEDLRRAALRKLFSDPHFSAIDMMDVYLDDYSRSDPIPAAMLKQLRQAQKILDWASGKEDGAESRETPSPEAADRAQALAEAQPAAPAPSVPRSVEPAVDAGAAPEAIGRTEA